ncbi:MAG: sodium:solute symporter [Bacteroidota bacterium]
MIWIILIAFLLFFLWQAPRANTVKSFFEAQSDQGEKPNLLLLTSSLVISWIFAKSITNAANLGLAFGWVGGLSYAVYYGSFIVAGIVIYQLRVKGGFQSLHHFLQSRFGRNAMILFSVLVGFRLFNEVWSNTLVIGSYFGETGSVEYYGAILVFTVLTLLYTLKGGMSSSILTDAVQMVLFGVLLFIILGYILPKSDFSLKEYMSTGVWKMTAGVDFFLVALIQVFSYPFHDAVLTDRGFLSDPKTTFRSFMWAGLIGFICIFLFSVVGMHAKLLGLEGQAAVEVSQLLGVGLMLVMNFIMITSAASTLDSAFTSGSKLLAKDIGSTKMLTVRRGRTVMIGFAVLGTLPIFLNPTILSATTISGTMVLGLAPVFLLWKMNTRPLAFHLAVGFGILVGILFALGLWPASLVFFEGTYGALLSANIVGTIGSFVLYFLGSGFRLSSFLATN